MKNIRNAGLALSLLSSGSIYTGCDECNTNLPQPPFVSRKTLSGLGTLFYGGLLYGSMADKEWTDPAIKLAVLAHIYLIGYSVFVLKKVCPVCLMAASGAFIAASGPAYK